MLLNNYHDMELCVGEVEENMARKSYRIRHNYCCYFIVNIPIIISNQKVK